MATVTLSPPSVSLGSVGAFTDVTVNVTGVPSGTSGTAVFPITVDGVVANGTLTISFPSTIPVHGTPTLSSTLTGKVTVVQQSVSPDGLTASYRVTRVA